MKLYYRTPNIISPAVVRLKELLELSDVDGSYDIRAVNAVRRFQKASGLKVDGIVGKKTWDKLVLTEFKNENKDLFFDIREEHGKPVNYFRPRILDEITGVMLHQTGCNMPNDPHKWKNLNAAFGITQQGYLIYVNDICDMIWHGNSLSPQTVGVEIEGNFFGINGKRSTLWKSGGGPDHLNQEMLDCLDVLKSLLKDLLINNWSFIGAHRQTSKSRRADPGQEIWKEVAIPWKNELNLIYYPKYGGYDIPSEWDSKQVFKLY